jgi:hypothetical protein
VILDPQQHVCAMLASEFPDMNRIAHVTEVQPAGRGWCEARATTSSRGHGEWRGFRPSSSRNTQSRWLR